MESYNNFISQFEILENPPQKKGFHRHHIVPQSEQIEKDDRQVYLTKAQHLWAHILYDQENGTKTADWLISAAHMRKSDIHSYDDCLPFNEVPETRTGLKPANAWEKGQIGAFSGRKHTQETKERMSQSHKGTPAWNKGIPCSEEHKEKLRLANLGKKHTDEWVEACHNWLINRWSDETKRQEMSTKIKGRKHFTNGEIEVMTYECPEGFWPGRLPRKKSLE